MKPIPTVTYDHKPAAITSARDLLTFIIPIPAAAFCVDKREDHRGRRCILGHLDKAFGYNNYSTNGFTRLPIVVVNNGVTGPYGYSPRLRGAKTTGRATKKRLVKAIKAKIVEEEGAK